MQTGLSHPSHLTLGMKGYGIPGEGDVSTQDLTTVLWNREGKKEFDCFVSTSESEERSSWLRARSGGLVI